MSSALRSLSLAVLVPSIALVGACGSSSSTEFFQDRPSSPSASDGSPEGSSAVEPATDGAASPDGPVVGIDGGKPKDAGKPDVVTVTDTGTPDVAVIPTDDGIVCSSTGTQFCKTATEACCLHEESGGLEYTCAAPNAPCSGLKMPCSDTVDCGGLVCCATYSNNSGGGYTKVACQATCGASTSNTTEFRLCDPNAAIDECLVMGLTCKASTAIAGWHICKS